MVAEIHIGSEHCACGQSTKGKRLKFFVLINKIFFLVGNILAAKMTKRYELLILTLWGGHLGFSPFQPKQSEICTVFNFFFSCRFGVKMHQLIKLRYDEHVLKRWPKSDIYSPLLFVPTNLGGYLVQKTQWGCAANMGSKISLSVYEWPLIKCKIWYMIGLIFQKFPKFEPKLAKILEKSWDFAQNLAKNWIDWYINRTLFLENWYMYESTFKFHGGTSLPKPNFECWNQVAQTTIRNWSTSIFAWTACGKNLRNFLPLSSYH